MNNKLRNSFNKYLDDFKTRKHNLNPKLINTV